MIEIEDGGHGGPHHWQAPRLTPIMAWSQAKPYSYSSEFPEAYFQVPDSEAAGLLPVIRGSASTCRLDLLVR